MATAVANRYARALADVVLNPGAGLDSADALAQLRDFAAALKESAELRNVLLSPAVSIRRKHAVVSRLAEPLALHRVIRNFLFVSVDHGRVASIDEIAAGLEAILDERLGRARAEVRSATILNQSDRDTVSAELARKTGKEVVCEFEVDPALLGGISVRIGSTVYDGSVRGQLEALRRRLG
jgi:F-type H+-transporting ATPase subunit delta